MCAEPIADAAPARRRPGQPRPDVHLPAAATCCSPPSTRSCATAPSPTGTCPSPARCSTPASGTSCRSRSAWRSSSPTPSSAARSPSIPGPPGPPSPSCRSGRGTASLDLHPVLRTLAPDVEALIVRMPDRTSAGRGPAAFLVPIDRCYELVGALRMVWRGFDGGQEARALLDGFFAELAARSRPAPEEARRRWLSWRSRVVDVVPEPYAAAPHLLARIRVEETTGERVHALALRAQIRIEPQRRRYDDTEERALLDLFGDRSRFAETLRPFAWLHASTVAQGFTGIDRDRAAAAVHVRLRGLGHHLPARAPATARSRCSSCSAAPSSPGARPGSPSPRCRGTARRGTGCRSRVWRDLMETWFPGTEWVRMRRDDGRGPRALPARPRAHHAGTTPSPRCSPGCWTRRGSSHDPRPAPGSPPTPSSTRGTCSTPTGRRAAKNQVRWQFGVLGPPGRGRRRVRRGGRPRGRLPAAAGRATTPTVTVHVRFLQLQRRQAERADGDGGFTAGRRAPRRTRPSGRRGTRPSRWTARWARSRPPSSAAACTSPCDVDGGEDVRGGAGRAPGPPPVAAAARWSTLEAPTDGPVLRLRVAVAQRRPAGRGQGRRPAVVADRHPPADVGRRARGSSPSSTRRTTPARPPAVAGSTAAGRSWPATAGRTGRPRTSCWPRRSSCPTIPRSPRRAPCAMFDSTEIDEILTLRVLTLTDEEKAQARATDPRAAAIIDRCEQLSPAELQRLHGIMRDPHGSRGRRSTGDDWWAAEAAGPVSPETDAVVVAGTRVQRGSRVRPAARTGAPTPRTCSSPARRPWSARCTSTSTGRPTWRSRSSTTPRPSSTTGTAATSTSPRTSCGRSRGCRPRTVPIPTIERRARHEGTRSPDHARARCGPGRARSPSASAPCRT